MQDYYIQSVPDPLAGAGALGLGFFLLAGLMTNAREIGGLLGRRD